MKAEVVEAKIREYMSTMQRHTKAPQNDIRMYVVGQIQMCETILGWMQSEEKPAVQEVTEQVKPAEKIEEGITSKEFDVLVAICEENVEMTFSDEVISRLQHKQKKGAITWKPTGKAVGGVLSSLEKKGYIRMSADCNNMSQMIIDGTDKAYEFDDKWVNTH